jgi:hypothetical protein
MDLQALNSSPRFRRRCGGWLAAWMLAALSARLLCNTKRLAGRALQCWRSAVLDALDARLLCITKRLAGGALQCWRRAVLDALDARLLGRKTRSIPPAIRRALNARDPGCGFPGCTSQRYLDAHHIEHWADGGLTKLSNLVSLCRTHHRLVHEGGIRVEAREGGGWRFSRPDGREFELLPPEPSRSYEWTELQETHESLGIQIDEDTAATRWRGERISTFPRFPPWRLVQHLPPSLAGLG